MIADEIKARDGGDGWQLHLGVEDAGLRLHHAHSAIEGLDGEEVALAVGHDGCNVQTDIHWVHLRREAVANALPRVRGDLDTVTGGGQVANVLALLVETPQAAAHEVDGDRVWLIIGESDQRLGRVTVDELHPEDLGGRERGLCRDGKAESLSLRNILGILCDKKVIMSVNGH